MFNKCITIKPEYNDCCSCIDVQILSKNNKNCDNCDDLKNGVLYNFYREKGKTYGIVSYESGTFDEVELWRIKIKKD